MPRHVLLPKAPPGDAPAVDLDLQAAWKLYDRQARFVGTLASGWRPDVFHIHLSWFSSFYRKLAWFQEAQATGRPVVVHLHAPDISAFYNTGRAHAAAMAYMFNRAARVVALTHAMADELRSLFGDGPRIEVLYNPV